MTRLLASVADPQEALMALDSGVDLIDCKDPSRGALGELESSLVRNVVETVRRRRPVSATLGDLPTATQALEPAIRRVAATGVDYVKLGLFDTGRIAHTLADLSYLARRHRLVAVLFADRAPRLEVIGELAAADFSGVMLDTAEKGSGDLLDHIATERLAEFVSRAWRHRLLCGLAGNLRLDRIPELLRLGPDYLGFRGALCAQGRESGLSRRRLAQVREAMRPTPPHRRSVFPIGNAA
jgi:dihydroneopterin aldolase